MDTLKYKGYEGTAEVDIDRGVCRGKILFIDDLVTYEAESPKQIKSEFEAAVEDYLETCRELGRDPKRPCSGQFNVRIDPELHKGAILRGVRDGVSLNKVVARAVEAYLTGQVTVNNEVSIVVSGGSDSQLVAAASSSGKTTVETLYAIH